MTIETANRLYKLRKKHNLSQEELAERLGVSRQAVSKWERGEASPDTDNLIALAKIYNLSLDELIYGEKEENGEEIKEESTKNSADSANDVETLYFDIDDGEDRVKISSDGIIVEEKNGSTVKINVNGKIMEKIIKQIEINENNTSNDGESSDCDDEDDDFYETVYFTEGDIKNTNKKLHIKIKKPTRFWLQLPYAFICAIAYLLCGFCEELGGFWEVLGGFGSAWVIFVTIPIYYSFVEAIYKRRFSHFAYPVFCAFIYFVMGVYFFNWHPSWLVFLTIPVYYSIAATLDKAIKRKKSSRIK